MINILGVKLTTLSKKEILDKLEGFIKDGRQHYLVTPNPEIILEARKNEELFFILNQADLSIPDGVGLKFAAWAMGKNIKRFTGADLVKEILANPIFKNLKIALANWESGLSKKKDLEKLFEILGIKNYFIKDVARVVEPNLDELISFQPDILFSNLGSPYQEKFIYHNLKKLPSVKFGLGVGGAFDFLTGRAERAPRWMRAMGLEWLWRLFIQPKRFKRIYQAVIIFPLKFANWLLINPFLYRPNVACILYRRRGEEIEILLAERRENPDHWQLPQGGTDGEDLVTAGSRELREEVGTDKFKAVASYKNLWRYRIPRVGKTGTNYKGQKQGLFVAEFFGSDEDIKINFWDHRSWKWVKADDIISTVYPERQEATKVFMEKFKLLFDPSNKIL